MMNILIVTDGVFPFVTGGMQKHAYYMIRSFIELRHPVSVVLPSLHKNDDKSQLNDKAHYIELPRKSYKFPLHYLLEEWQYSKSVFAFLSGPKGNVEKYDVIIAKGFTVVAWPKKRKNWPLVFNQLHGLEMFQRTLNFRSNLEYIALRYFAQRSLKNADQVLCYGGKIKQLHQNILGSTHKLNVSHGGVPEVLLVDAITPSKHPIKLLFIGRNERRKGIPELTHIIKNLLSVKKSFTLNWIGDIPESLKVISNQVVYHGSITNSQDYFKIVDSCDVLLLPSISEGFPTVIVESMGRGLTVLSMEVGAISEVINESNGWLVSSHEEFETTLKNILDEEVSIVKQKKQNALETVRDKFVWSAISSELIEIFKYRNDHR